MDVDKLTGDERVNCKCIDGKNTKNTVGMTSLNMVFNLPQFFCLFLPVIAQDCSVF